MKNFLIVSAGFSGAVLTRELVETLTGRRDQMVHRLFQIDGAETDSQDVRSGF